MANVINLESEKLRRERLTIVFAACIDTSFEAYGPFYDDLGDWEKELRCLDEADLNQRYEIALDRFAAIVGRTHKDAFRWAKIVLDRTKHLMRRAR